MDIDKYNKSFSNKKYVYGRGEETEYYILTIKLDEKSYRLKILRNHKIIEESFYDGLTKAKYGAFEWLLNFDPLIFKMNKVTMVHYVENRENNRNPWENETNKNLHENLEKYLKNVKGRPEKKIIKEMIDAEETYNQHLLKEELQSIEEKEITKTENQQVIKSRIGQSTFKKALLAYEKKCRLCGVTDERFLVASHIKQWIQSNNQERLDINNGLLLCPNHDALFDKGYISFGDDGSILISESLEEETKVFLNINETMKIMMKERQREYMKWHRENLFKCIIETKEGFIN